MAEKRDLGLRGSRQPGPKTQRFQEGQLLGLRCAVSTDPVWSLLWRGGSSSSWGDSGGGTGRNGRVLAAVRSSSPQVTPVSQQSEQWSEVGRRGM